MSQAQTPQWSKMQTHVSFHTHADGSVSIVATGRNGSLTLKVDGGERGPAMSVLSNELKPQAGWTLEANGRVKGWLVDDAGKIKWFPERTTHKTRKRSVKGRQTKGKQ